ncbi:zinc finger, CCHC-type containing protein [Tanacetum coccineum]|uniref:Zinc finger, CCHC-type containing protein n=1 Tax=Tanacetum coccineum TaxID=301880 RepID=A0ABQ5I652_9ASTR
MTRTREGYGSCIARPKIEDKDHFELKGQFLKELLDSGSDNEDVNENIEKVLEIVLSWIVLEVLFDVACIAGCLSRIQVNFPFIYHLYDDCYDEEDGSYELKDLDGYSIGTTLLDDALPTKEKDPGSFTLHYNIGNLCFNKALVDLGANVSVMPFSSYTKLGLGELAPTKLIVELADRTVKHPKGITENVLVGINKKNFPVDFIILDMPEDIKTPLILGRPFLSTAYAKIDMFKRKITLRVRNDKVVFKSDKPTRNIIKRAMSTVFKRRGMELDLEARLMGKALILNRSLDPLYGDYIELNDLNKPLDLKRNQIDDLEPTIEEDFHFTVNTLRITRGIVPGKDSRKIIVDSFVTTCELYGVQQVTLTLLSLIRIYNLITLGSRLDLCTLVLVIEGWS